MNEFQLEAKVTQQIAIETNIEKLDMFLEVVKDKYANRLVTEDDLTNSKKDRATLNKIVAQLKKAKKDVETDGKKNINEFLQKIDEAVNEISEISNNIDDQVKAYEAVEKEKKLKLAEATRIKILVEMNINEDIREFIKLDSKVTNKTYTMTKIEDDLKIKASAIQDKYNFVMKEINKNNAGLTNKIFFDDVKSIFDTDLTNIVSRVETTADLRKAQEEKVKRETEEKVKKENEKAIEEAREEERKKDEIEKNNLFQKACHNVADKEKGTFNINEAKSEYKKLHEEKYGNLPEENRKTEEIKQEPENTIVKNDITVQNGKERIELTEEQCDQLIMQECIDIDSFHYSAIEEKEFPEDKGRWDYPVEYILKRNDNKLFRFTFQRGLTESQDNYCYDRFLEEYIEPEKHAYITIQVDGLSKEVTEELLSLIGKHELNYEYEER